jgi:hypothetical protein
MVSAIHPVGKIETKMYEIIAKRYCVTDIDPGTMCSEQVGTKIAVF